MWAWINGKLATLGALIGVGFIIVISLLKQGRQKEEIENEKAKSKEQDETHKKQIEVIRTVENVKAKNVTASDSSIIDRLRSKWQRD